MTKIYQILIRFSGIIIFDIIHIAIKDDTSLDLIFHYLYSIKKYGLGYPNDSRLFLDIGSKNKLLHIKFLLVIIRCKMRVFFYEKESLFSVKYLDILSQ